MWCQANAKCADLRFFLEIFHFSLPQWEQNDFSCTFQSDNFPLQQVCNVPRMAYSSSIGSVEKPSPVTFLTEDEKMMKETGSCNFFSFFCCFLSKFNQNWFI